MPDSFSATRYPSVEDTLHNNAQSLYKQKRQFLGDLRTLVGTSGSALIGVLYVRDISMFLFFLRSATQFFLSTPFAVHLQYGSLREEAKNEQRWFLLWTVFLVNGISLLDHVLLGTYSASRASDGQLHGGLSVQFIGERLPYSRYELVVLDGLIFGFQLLYFCLMCTTEDSDVLSGSVGALSVDETIQTDVVSDGFDGNVSLLTIDVWASVKSSWRFQRRVPLPDEDTTGSYRERALRRMFV